MSNQIFTPAHNTIAKYGLIGVVVLVSVLLCTLDLLHRSPYVRYTGVPRTQPVPFSHKHHTNLGIDCRYCHTTVEDSAFANIPPTKTCMNCHNLMWNEAPMLEPVRESWKTKESLEWVRVHDLPDFVYFDHSIHVNKGIGCATCHGRVDEMPITWREKPLFMKWCLECHRDPAQFVRPKDQITVMDYEFPANQEELGAQLVKEYGIEHENYRLTNCSICHR